MIDLIDEAVNAGARRNRACAEAGINPSTYWLWHRANQPARCTKKPPARGVSAQGKIVVADARPEVVKPRPANALTDSERHEVLRVCNSPEFASLPPGQIVPTLADRGRYVASESTFYRVLRSVGQNAHRGSKRPPKARTARVKHVAGRANQVWCWDITWLAAAVAGTFYKLYLVMDVYSRKIVGWEVHDTETSEHASTVVAKACLAEQVAPGELTIHADNGPAMKGGTLLATLHRLGVDTSYSRPSVSNDNAFSESIFATLKHVPSYPRKPFESLEAARVWVHEFVRWYNTEHLHRSIRFVTPLDRHEGRDQAVLAARAGVYAAAKEQRPGRWSGPVRCWDPVEEVVLNPHFEEVASRTV